MKKLTFVVVVFLLTVIGANAGARIYIPIDQPVDAKFPIAVADLYKGDGGSGSASKIIPDIIRNDLDLSGYFNVIAKKAYLEKNDVINADAIDFKKWTMVGARAVVKGSITNVEGRIVVQLKLFDPVDGQMLIGKQYTFESKDLRRIAHKFSDEVMLSLTGIRGVFGTKIAYSNITSKRSKGITIMDIDGENLRRITKDKSINMGPAWSPDGTKLTYTSFAKGNPDIFVTDLASGRSRQITNNHSTNVTPAWSPNGTWIAYSSSAGGNMEVYVTDPDGGNTRKLTNAFGIDIAPRFSPDSNEMVYSSERGGALHVYRMSVAGGTPTRLTYVGSHNDAPDWSPDGQKVVFAGRQGRYDVFTVNIDGTNVQRLTMGSGSNEHPRWSPDGRFIVFSSDRSGKAQIYMMRFDGANQTLLTKKDPGLMPSWSPWEY